MDKHVATHYNLVGNDVQIGSTGSDVQIGSAGNADEMSEKSEDFVGLACPSCKVLCRKEDLGEVNNVFCCYKCRQILTTQDF